MTVSRCFVRGRIDRAVSIALAIVPGTAVAIGRARRIVPKVVVIAPKPAAEIEPSGPHTLTIERRDVPLCMIEWWSINATGYAEKALILAGVKQPTLTYRYEETGVAHGVPLGRVVITIDRAR